MQALSPKCTHNSKICTHPKMVLKFWITHKKHSHPSWVAVFFDTVGQDEPCTIRCEGGKCADITKMSGGNFHRSSFIQGRFYLVNNPMRSPQVFFLITNQKSENPPAPATTIAPMVIPAIAPPESPSFGSSALHSSQI